MPVGYLQARKGVRLQGPLIPLLVATMVGALPIFQQSTFAAQVGTRTFRIKRIKGLNQVGANTLVHIGTLVGGVVVDIMPPLQTFDGLNFDWGETDLPEVEVNADLLAYADAAGALAPLYIQIEVEEIG